MVIWDGPSTLIDTFVAHCNNNQLGPSFTTVWNKNSLAFLDLELGQEQNHIFALNYTKPTAGNLHVHFNSCHNLQWVKNIPKGQFCRLRQNCTTDSDYTAQSTLLRRKFLEKGYPETLVDQAYNTFFSGKPSKTEKPPENPLARFIIRYHGQYKKMENILNKHWNILTQDPHINSILGDSPEVMYRRAPTLKNKIAPSKQKETKEKNPLCSIPLKGMYQS